MRGEYEASRFVFNRVPPKLELLQVPQDALGARIVAGALGTRFVAGALGTGPVCNDSSYTMKNPTKKNRIVPPTGGQKGFQLHGPPVPGVRVAKDKPQVSIVA